MPTPPAIANNSSGPVGGGVPIGSSIVQLIMLAAGYGGKKVSDFKKHDSDLVSFIWPMVKTQRK